MMIDLVRKAGPSDHSIERWVQRIGRSPHELVAAVRSSVWASKSVRQKVLLWLSMGQSHTRFGRRPTLVVVNRQVDAALVVKPSRDGVDGQYTVVTVVSLRDVEDMTNQHSN